ncbi:manganese-binding transcriptional regulator MntR [Pirellulimonas nuda]|nr:manganese-binding transcriptional regulator MntR [Pirellulimonas nuda]
MPDPSPSADAHRRTRRDHAAETAEDYVEAIDDLTQEAGVCRVVDLAKRFAVSHVTVTRTVTRLVRDGLAETEPYAPIRLTPKGKRLASAARKRHGIVLDFLRAIGVREGVALIDAEGIEHHVSAETLRRFAELTLQLRSAGNEKVSAH